MKENPTILLVDDHAVLRKTLYDWLMFTLSPCHVIETESAEKALAVMPKTSPDIIIMDVALPGLSGIEATHQIKNCYSKVPIVMLSIYEETVYQEASFRAGASAYVIKREMRDNLIPVLKKLLNGKNGKKLSVQNK